MKTRVRMRSGLELTLAIDVESFVDARCKGGLREFPCLDFAEPMQVWIVMSEVECFWGKP